MYNEYNDWDVLIHIYCQLINDRINSINRFKKENEKYSIHIVQIEYLNIKMQ